MGTAGRLDPLFESFHSSDCLVWTTQSKVSTLAASDNSWTKNGGGSVTRSYRGEEDCMARDMWIFFQHFVTFESCENSVSFVSISIERKTPRRERMYRSYWIARHDPATALQTLGIKSVGTRRMTHRGLFCGRWSIENRSTSHNAKKGNCINESGGSPMPPSNPSNAVTAPETGTTILSGFVCNSCTETIFCAKQITSITQTASANHPPFTTNTITSGINAAQVVACTSDALLKMEVSDSLFT